MKALIGTISDMRKKILEGFFFSNSQTNMQFFQPEEESRKMNGTAGHTRYMLSPTAMVKNLFVLNKNAFKNRK